MLYLALLSAILSQAEAPATDTSAAASAERAAAAAERAAVSAQRAAEAVQRLAELQAGAPIAPVVDAAAPAIVDPWKGLVGLGLIAMWGNAETLTATANAALDKKFGQWGFGLRANGAYGQSRPPSGTATEVSALRAGLLLRGDRQVASFVSIFALAGLETDHVKSVELRGFGELGTGIKFYERKDGELERIYLRGDVGFRAAHETRFQYYTDATTPAGTGLKGVSMIGPRLGVVFRYAVNKDIRISEEAEYLTNLLGPERHLVNSATKLSARLTETVALTGSFLLTYDSAPAVGKKSTDTVLALGIEAAF